MKAIRFVCVLVLLGSMVYVVGYALLQAQSGTVIAEVPLKHKFAQTQTGKYVGEGAFSRRFEILSYDIGPTSLQVDLAQPEKVDFFLEAYGVRKKKDVMGLSEREAKRLADIHDVSLRVKDENGLDVFAIENESMRSSSSVNVPFLFDLAPGRGSTKVMFPLGKVQNATSGPYVIDGNFGFTWDWSSPEYQVYFVAKTGHWEFDVRRFVIAGGILVLSIVLCIITKPKGEGIKIKFKNKR